MRKRLRKKGENMKEKNAYIVSLVKKMSLEEKVGAVLTLGFSGVVPKQNVYDYIIKYHCGGLRLSPEFRIFGNYVDPNSNKTVVKVKTNVGIKYDKIPPVCTASEYKAILDDFQMVARNRHLSIPLHFSFDQEGGSSADFFFGGVNIYPKPMGIAATGDEHMAYLTAKATSEQAKSVGFNWIHSPVLDVNSNPANPEIATRSYSDSAEVVARYAVQACRGYKEGGMIATGKHFPGRGHSSSDAHFGVPVIDVDYDTLWNRELLPYRVLIKEGLLPSIMIAHTKFPALDDEHIATVSRKILTDLLRVKMGFEGVIATDSMTMGGVVSQYGVANACAMALKAGADLVLMKAENELVDETFHTILQYVKDGKISIEELNEKVYRVLKLKYEYGLFHHTDTRNVIPEVVLEKPEYKELAYLVARKSVLIYKNKENLLPLDKNKKTLIIEQKVKNYNSLSWHSGILYEDCLKLGANVDYSETAYHYDQEDEGRVKQALKEYDTIVITNYYLRTLLSNKAFLEKVLKGYKGKVVIVTNTPYELLSIPEGAEHVVINFATSPENVRATAAVLYGVQKPEGVWPLVDFGGE